MSNLASKKFHTGTVKKKILVRATQAAAWKKVGNVVGLPDWIDEIKKATYRSKKKRGVGTIRKLVFADGSIIEEHVVGWDDRRSLSYVATSGLPLRVYYATLSITPKKRAVVITWESYFNSKKMTKTQFSEFVSFLESFYSRSLKNLKSIIECQK